jgi:hypothetical protein
MSIDLPTLLKRATSGKQLDKSQLFRPSWFYSMIDDPFWVWCEYHAPAVERIDETTIFDRYLMQQGNEWEDRYVRGAFPDAYVVSARWGEASLRETLEAMLRGETAIHNAALWPLLPSLFLCRSPVSLRSWLTVEQAQQYGGFAGGATTQLPSIRRPIRWQFRQLKTGTGRAGL